MKEINLFTWFTERQLTHCPTHFVATRTPLTDASREWIVDKLSGRYFIGQFISTDEVKFMTYCPLFEDPQEAMLYELTWS